VWSSTPSRAFPAIGYGPLVAAVEVRRFGVSARSTDVFGRVLWSCRDQHFVADGPVHNGCPGEAVTPAELFLAGVASCGVELIEVLARESDVPLAGVEAEISGELDPANPVREDVKVFNSVRLAFRLRGVGEEQAAELVEGFKGRCPLYGSVAVATPDVAVTVSVSG
jgi:uncharacterized OsmC-like protein